MPQISTTPTVPAARGSFPADSAGVPSARRPARFNIARVVLWVASVAVAAAGYLLMTSSNAKQAAIYTAGTADYPKLFAAQSGSTVGGLLIAVGVLGALLALASLAISWRPASVVATSDPAPIDEDDDLEDETADDDDTLDEVDADARDDVPVAAERLGGEPDGAEAPAAAPHTGR